MSTYHVVLFLLGFAYGLATIGESWTTRQRVIGFAFMCAGIAVGHPA